MFWIGRGDWQFALVLFVIGNVGVAGSIVFYESLLPHLVADQDLDRVSTAGYAVGYMGGGMLLAINLMMIQKPEWFGIPDAGTATRLALASVAVWWVVFSIPLFRRVPEPAVRARARRTSRRQCLSCRREAAAGDVSRASALSRCIRLPAGVPALQRRDPDDDPHGDDLRHADRPARERDDHGAADDAVHRHSVRLRVRHGGGADRRADGGVRRDWPYTW